MTYQKKKKKKKKKKTESHTDPNGALVSAAPLGVSVVCLLLIKGTNWLFFFFF